MLAVSGLGLVVREPTGEDELFVLEGALAPPEAVVGLAGRVAVTADGEPVDWASLPAAGLGAVALGIRRAWLGDSIHTNTTCPAPGCEERIDVSFGIERYISYHRPRRPRAVVTSEPEGWYLLQGASVRFRIPTTVDLLEAIAADSPEQELTQRCVQGEVSAALRRRIDRALTALAPRLDGFVGGICPECQQTVSLRFDPVVYTMSELREAFSSLYFETHLLASAYGWSEPEILSLPRDRRRHYAALVEDERAAA